MKKYQIVFQRYKFYLTFSLKFSQVNFVVDTRKKKENRVLDLNFRTLDNLIRNKIRTKKAFMLSFI